MSEESRYVVHELEWQSENILKIVIFKFNSRTPEDNLEHAHIPNRIIHMIIENNELAWKTRFGEPFMDPLEKQKIMAAVDIYFYNMDCAKHNFETLVGKGLFKD